MEPTRAVCSSSTTERITTVGGTGDNQPLGVLKVCESITESITLCDTLWQRDSKEGKGITNNQGDKETGRCKGKVEVMRP